MATPARDGSALARHDRIVREEMEQAEGVRSTAGRPADFWSGERPSSRSRPSQKRPPPTCGS
jgi:hypothetical protein